MANFPINNQQLPFIAINHDGRSARVVRLGALIHDLHLQETSFNEFIYILIDQRMPGNAEQFLMVREEIARRNVSIDNVKEAIRECLQDLENLI